MPRHSILFVLSHLLFAPGWLLVLGCSPNSASGAQQTRPDQSIEARVHSLINAERVQQGLPELTRHNELDQLARKHSERMATQQVAFGHADSKDRADQIRQLVSANGVAENVAQNTGYQDPASVTVEGWLESRGHRRNILGDFDLTGIGLAHASDGTVFITQLFADVVDAN